MYEDNYGGGDYYDDSDPEIIREGFIDTGHCSCNSLWEDLQNIGDWKISFGGESGDGAYNDFIAKAMKNGDISVYAEPIYTYLYKGERYILDGHHRIKAAIKANMSLEVIELNATKAMKLFKSKIEEIHQGLH
ncbi:hypothetical protein J2X97_002960 [Epilithonimonas hungarica]|uniref:hypothetical protein n=1 Tax=Epilithonimonas hungarica TaxID=454006 RepID=UPI00277DE894|nr:hypothetical protein [Epilithonimonas hungarica]MDP9957294.1 hypothetical protein [Epilithonimonas hungarica]